MARGQMADRRPPVRQLLGLQLQPGVRWGQVQQVLHPERHRDEARQVASGKCQIALASNAPCLPTPEALDVRSPRTPAPRHSSDKRTTPLPEDRPMRRFLPLLVLLSLAFAPAPLPRPQRHTFVSPSMEGSWHSTRPMLVTATHLTFYNNVAPYCRVTIDR